MINEYFENLDNIDPKDHPTFVILKNGQLVSGAGFRSHIYVLKSEYEKFYIPYRKISSLIPPEEIDLNNFIYIKELQLRTNPMLYMAGAMNACIIDNTNAIIPMAYTKDQVNTFKLLLKKKYFQMNIYNFEVSYHYERYIKCIKDKIKSTITLKELDNNLKNKSIIITEKFMQDLLPEFSGMRINDIILQGGNNYD